MEKKKLENINNLIGNDRSTEHIPFSVLLFICGISLNEANQRISRI
ncbi:hypothetical protein [Clostridium sp. OS1-26]|nr:hypothetical protein [Clostridium sp. OS1-26]WML37898.1 hypothetical protein RCG18_05735 [Clostridium sp. OS1-26]